MDDFIGWIFSVSIGFSLGVMTVCAFADPSQIENGVWCEVRDNQGKVLYAGNATASQIGSNGSTTWFADGNQIVVKVGTVRCGNLSTK